MKFTTKIIEYNDHFLGCDPEGREIPFTLPGEVVLAQKITHKNYPDRYELIEILEASPERKTPPCPYFGQCGGCQMQHVNPETYETLKKSQVEKQLQLNNLKTPIDSFSKVKESSRRRVTLKAIREKNKLKIGFFKYQSHELVDIETCLLLTPKIEALIVPLKHLLELFFRDTKPKNILITEADNGIDLSVEASLKSLPLQALEALTAFCYEHQILRFSLNTEILLEREKPRIQIDSLWVDIAQNAFLQASLESNQTLMKYLQKGLKLETYQKGVDLFSGRGTYAIPLSTIPIDAFESDQHAVSDLKRAISLTKIPVSVTQRDLYKYPLNQAELSAYDFAVLNPPRSGAYAQCKEIARSKLKQIAYISCNPKTFARDASLLLDHFELHEFHLFDQFLYSSHVELIAFFGTKLNSPSAL